MFSGETNISGVSGSKGMMLVQHNYVSHTCGYRDVMSCQWISKPRWSECYEKKFQNWLKMVMKIWIDRFYRHMQITKTNLEALKRLPPMKRK